MSASYQFMRRAAKSRYAAFPRGKNSLPPYSALSRSRPRLWREFQSGKLSPANWHRHEAKRAANRLHDKWKKDPWLPGWTIDLGQAEGEMTDSLRDFGVDGDRLAPAVVDWLRWRYRRTQPEETLEAILATP